MAFDCSLMYVEYVTAYTVVSCSLCHINIQLHKGCISRGISRNVEGGGAHSVQDRKKPIL